MSIPQPIPQTTQVHPGKVESGLGSGKDIADALIEALLQRQVRCVNGEPGDDVLDLFDRLERSAIETICTAGAQGRQSGRAGGRR